MPRSGQPSKVRDITLRNSLSPHLQRLCPAAATFCPTMQPFSRRPTKTMAHSPQLVGQYAAQLEAGRERGGRVARRADRNRLGSDAARERAPASSRDRAAGHVRRRIPGLRLRPRPSPDAAPLWAIDRGSCARPARRVSLSHGLPLTRSCERLHTAELHPYREEVRRRSRASHAQRRHRPGRLSALRRHARSVGNGGRRFDRCC